MPRLFAIILFALGAIHALAADREDDPAVLGVLFYADWCGSCKTLDPLIKQARDESGLDSKSVLFVRLDLTDETRRHQSELLANALGIGASFEKNAGKTGFMLLFDADSGEVISRVTKSMDAKAISAAVNEAVKAGS